MAKFLERRMVLAVKIEAVEGTPETLAGADANLLAYNVSFEPSVDQFERSPIAADFSNYGPITGKRSARVRFKAELKGSGTAGTAPAIGKLLKACGASETIVALTSATYAPLTVAVPTVTIGLYSLPESGNNIKEFISGAQGTWKFSAKVGEPVMLEFDFLGCYEPTVDIATITPTGLETIKPIALLATSFTAHSFANHKISTLTMDAGNELQLREDINEASGYFSTYIARRKPVFSFDPEKELVATHDYYGKMLSNAEASLSLALTGSAGNITTISAPKSQYVQVKPGARNGLQIFQIDGQLNRNAGNDEWSIAFT